MNTKLFLTTQKSNQSKVCQSILILLCNVCFKRLFLDYEGPEWFEFERHYLAIHCIGKSAIQFNTMRIWYGYFKLLNGKEWKRKEERLNEGIRIESKVNAV